MGVGMGDTCDMDMVSISKCLDLDGFVLQVADVTGPPHRCSIVLPFC